MALISTISPSRTDILTALRGFLLSVLPDGVEAVLGVENRVPQVMPPNCCIFTPIRFQRISTNVDSTIDVLFAGSISPAPAVFTGAIAPAPSVFGLQPSGILTVSSVASGVLLVGGVLAGTKVAAGTTITAQLSGPAGGAGTYRVDTSQTTPSTSITQTCGLMTVSSVTRGPIIVGATVFGVGVAAGTKVTALGTGTGDVGTYAVSISQTVANETLASGVKALMQSSKVTVQIDFHSIDGSSADTAQIVSTTFRDAVAVQFFSALDYPLNQVSPFYADDPRQMPFLNENSQYEWRWVLEAEMNVNQGVFTPQQFFTALDLEVINVDAEYPPT